MLTCSFTCGYILQRKITVPFKRQNTQRGSAWQGEEVADLLKNLFTMDQNPERLDM
jgi:hypothetical protein